jgi:hypothetical protein
MALATAERTERFSTHMINTAPIVDKLKMMHTSYFYVIYLTRFGPI